MFAYLYICKVCVCVGLESRYACHPNLGASSPQDCHNDTQQVAMETTLIGSKTESTISRCLGSGGRNARASHCSALPGWMLFQTAALAKASAG